MPAIAFSLASGTLPDVGSPALGHLLPPYVRGVETAGATSDFAAPRSGITSSAAASLVPPQARLRHRRVGASIGRNGMDRLSDVVAIVTLAWTLSARMCSQRAIPTDTSGTITKTRAVMALGPE
jgi:hypothetical protein